MFSFMSLPFNRKIVFRLDEVLEISVNVRLKMDLDFSSSFYRGEKNEP